MTTASEHELSAAIDRMAEVTIDFMAARVKVLTGKGREGGRVRRCFLTTVSRPAGREHE